MRTCSLARTVSNVEHRLLKGTMQHAGSIGNGLPCPRATGHQAKPSKGSSESLWFATKNNTLAQRNANVANPRFTQTQQVGVDTRQTQRKFFGHGDLETLRMSLRGCSRPTDSPLLFVCDKAKTTLARTRDFPKRENNGPNERSTRCKIELTARTKRYHYLLTSPVSSPVEQHAP